MGYTGGRDVLKIVAKCGEWVRWWKKLPATCCHQQWLVVRTGKGVGCGPRGRLKGRKVASDETDPLLLFFLLDRKWVHHLILDWESQLGSQVTNRWNPYRLDWPFPKPTQPVSRADLTKKETALMPLMVGVAILIWLGGASGSAGLNWPMACQLHVAQACDIQWIFSFLEKHVSDKTSWHPCFRVCSAVVVSTFH